MDTAPSATIGGLSERTLSLCLFTKYTLLAACGIWAAVVEVPTFVIVGSPEFTLLWATTVATFAILAATGVMLSWTTGRHWLERWTTAAFVPTFLAYSSALIYRAAMTNDWSSSAFIVIPVAVCILPTVRYYSLVRRMALARRAAR